MNDRLERARWIERCILPLEPALRSWLAPKLRGLSGLDVDDVVQEAYAILGGLASVDHIRAPRNYVFQTAYSIVLAQYRRNRIVPIDYMAELDRIGAAAEAPSPEAEMSGLQEMLRLAELVLALPARQREAFQLLKLEGMSQREAAARMCISESTLEKHVAKALYTLTKSLGRSGSSSARASGSRNIGETDKRETTRKQRQE